MNGVVKEGGWHGLVSVFGIGVVFIKLWNGVDGRVDQTWLFNPKI